MKKILSLLALMMLTMTSAWAGTATFDLGTKDGVSTPAGFFKSVGEKWNWNNKFKGGEYDGISFSNGLKMEGSTKIGFTTEYPSTVTIVQSTWSANTITLDGNELDVNGATAGTGCRIYTIENVEAGDHVIGRGSGESGLFYVKVEWADAYTATFENTGNWAEVYAYAWVGEVKPLGEWPGTQLIAGADGKFPVTIEGTKPEKIIFNNNAGVQTDDLDFKDGGVYNASGRVITLTTYSATFKTDGMTSVWAYVWNGDEKALGDWPGTQMNPDNDNTWKIEITTEDAPKFIIFHDNAGNQTPDLAFEDGKAYEYMLNDYAVTFKTDAGWGSVNAYAWSGEGDKVKEFLGTWPGEAMIPANEINNGFGISFKAFNAPEKIIFNSAENNEEKTADLPFINEKAYKWITATPYYALKDGDTFAAGTTVDLGDATITYGVQDGAEFGAAVAAVNEDYAGFDFMTVGNGENGTATSGTVYTIVPKYDGTITIGVRLNGGKKMHINEDGTDLADYAGITIKDAANTTFDFAVKAGSTYKIWCDGSKLGFFGFDYKFTKPETTYTVNFDNRGNWAEVYAYAWHVKEGEASMAPLLGNWPGTKMEQGEGGIYTITFPAPDEPSFIIFNNGVEGEGAIQTDDLKFEDGKTYVFGEEPNVEITAVALMGSSNEWAEPIATFTAGNPSTGYLTVSDVQFAANDEFKIRVSYSNNTEEWYAPVSEGNFLVNEEQLGKELTLTNEGNQNMYVEKDAKLTFALAPGFGTLTITGELTDPVFEPVLANGAYYLVSASEEGSLAIATDGTLNGEGAPFTFTFNETNGKYTIEGSEFFAGKEWNVVPTADGYLCTLSTEIEGKTEYVAIVSTDNNLAITIKNDAKDAAKWQPVPAESWENDVLSYNIAGTADLCGTEWDVTANKMIKNIEEGVYEWKAENVIVSQYHKPEFKVAVSNTVDEEVVAWYPEGDNWQINTDVTDEEGVFNVTITFNNVTKEITVSTEKTGEIPVKPYTVYFENNGNWAKVYAYAWYVAPEPLIGEAILTEAWPGDEMTQDPETGKFAITIESKLEPTYIVFNNGEDGEALIQTVDLEFEDGKTYSYEIPAEDIYVLVSDGDIAAALADAKAKVAKVGDIIIELDKESNAVFSLGSTLTAPNNITIWGNDHMIQVADEMTDPFITLDGTEALAKKADGSDSDHKLISSVAVLGVKVVGLKNAIIKDKQKTYVETVELSWDNIELAAGKNVFDFNGQGYIGNLYVQNSTIWGKEGTGFFAQYGSRPKNINGDWYQTFNIHSNTFVNIANGKNMCDLKQNGTDKNQYFITNNIFVDCGKQGQVVVGFNKGQTSATPDWGVSGNYFEWGGACVNAAEIEKAGQKNEEDIVQNCVDGKLTFADAANGDFNGEILLAEGAEYPAAIPGAAMWTINIKAIPGFYLVGTMNDWTVSSDYKMAPNDGQPEDPEYMITLDLKAGAQFKVVSVAENGAWTWYPYGEDCSVENEGNYTIYCQPNGNDEWTWKYVYAQYNGPATGINGIYAEKLNNATIYNLNGQRIQNAQKGLYIINGRKVVVK